MSLVRYRENGAVFTPLWNEPLPLTQCVVIRMDALSRAGLQLPDGNRGHICRTTRIMKTSIST